MEDMLKPHKITQQQYEYLKTNGYEKHISATYHDCTVVDFKTVSQKPANTDTIPFGYKIQMLAYAYALRTMGYVINRIRVVYGVRPTKTIGARCIVVDHVLDYVTDKLIGDTLKLMSETIIMARDLPQYRHLLFKSWELKV